MTSSLFTELLKAVAILGVFLLIGAFLRAKAPFFRKLLLPASVIGGFLALIVGPRVLNLIPFSEDYLNTWSLLPSILIVPIFAAAPLGNGMGADRARKKKGLLQYGPSVLLMCALFSTVSCLQGVVGYGVNLVFTAMGWDLHRTFGWELSQGFAGGHGTASAIGGILQDFQLDYWSTAQSVGVTMATVGLLGGMLIGIWMIKRANDRKEIAGFDAGVIPETTARGVITDPEQQGSLGRGMFLSSSVDPVTVHLAIILLGCGIAYWVRATLGEMNGAFSSCPVWFYALVIMYGINYCLCRLKLDWMIDKKVKARVTGPMSDVAICGAIASCDVSAVLELLTPIAVMCVLGFLVSWITFPIARRVFRGNYAFERMIVCWGANTGVTITGMMLLKICDPDYQTPALAEFSMGFALMSIISTVTSPIYYGLIAEGSTMANLMFNVVIGGFYILMGVLAYLAMRRAKAT